MRPNEEYYRNKKGSVFDDFDYEWMIGIAFRPSSTKYILYRLSSELSSTVLEEYSFPSTCLYSCEDENFDNAIFKDWGWGAKRNKENSLNDIYIDNLYDKMEHLLNIDHDIRKTLPNAKDRLYKRAIIRYFKELLKEISSPVAESSKIRYTMTYSSEWIPEQVSYLRSLVQIAGIVDKGDHPDRLLMYSEGESILRILQEPHEYFDVNIKHGYRYLICDMTDIGIKMNMYDIELPAYAENNLKVGRHRDWDIEYLKEPPQLRMGNQNMFEMCETYLLRKLFVSSKILAIQDFKQLNESVLNLTSCFSRLVDKVMEDGIEELSKWAIEENDPFTYTHRLSLQPQVLLSNSSEIKSSQSQLSFADTDIEISKIRISEGYTHDVIVYPAELYYNVFKSTYELIINYLESILRTTDTSIEAVIFVGDLCCSVYLMELLNDVCERASIKCIEAFQHSQFFFKNVDPALNGALRKSLDEVEGRLYVPRIEWSDSGKSVNSAGDDFLEIVLLIDYTSKSTEISYIPAQPDQMFDVVNIKSIMDWPTQFPLDEVLPTMEVLLIPGDKFNGDTGKRFISLKEDNDHRKRFLEQTKDKEMECIYYTFEKCKQDIIRFTHRLKISRDESNGFPPDDDEEIQNNLNICVNESTASSSAFATNESRSLLPKELSNRTNNTLHVFAVSQQHISFKEFSVMYFEYLTSFLFDCLHSKLGKKNMKIHYCITWNNYNESDGLRLSDEDIHDIVSKSGMLSKKVGSPQHTLLTLESAEVTALYCRDLIGIINANDRSEDTGFIQLQLNPEKCLLLLNRIPFYDGYGNDKQVEESRRSIHKHIKSKNIPFNFVGITCQNLWTHIQKNEQNLLEKCRKHSSSKRFYNISNMQVFNDLLLFYLSTANLELTNDEKVHDISTCREGECCRVHITNMDILQFGFVPTINKLASNIQCSISNQHFHQGLHINNIFLMGTFLFCRFQKDFKFLEDLLLLDLRRIKLHRSNDLKLLQELSNIHVTKIDVNKIEEKNQNDSGEINSRKDPCSIANNALKKLITAGKSLNDRLLERYATKSYAIRLVSLDKKDLTLLNDKIERNKSISGPYITCNQLDSQSRFNDNTLIPVIKKGRALSSSRSIEEEIYTSFTIFNCSKAVDISIELYVFEENDYGIHWKYKLASNYKSYFRFNCTNPSYPIIFKTHLSQTGSYKFWVEYDGNDIADPISMNEKVVLKSINPGKCKQTSHI